MSINPTPDENTYILDAESAAEMARLTNQDRLITKGMGGLFPERDDVSTMSDILDIACGPGGWALDVAYEYPEIQHESMYQNCMIAFKLVQPFMIKIGIATQEEVDQRYQQMVLEIMSDDFCGLWYYLTTWGQKPE